MPIRRWDPLHDLISLHQDFFGERARLGMSEKGMAAWAPPVDIFETAESFVLKVEVPGIDPDKIKVEFKQSSIIISGERPPGNRDQARRYHQVERLYGPFERAVSMPPYICCAEIRAHYKDGVLEIIVPKEAEKGPKTIQVRG